MARGGLGSAPFQAVGAPGAELSWDEARVSSWPRVLHRSGLRAASVPSGWPGPSHTSWAVGQRCSGLSAKPVLSRCHLRARGHLSLGQGLCCACGSRSAGVRGAEIPSGTVERGVPVQEILLDPGHLLLLPLSPPPLLPRGLLSQPLAAPRLGQKCSVPSMLLLLREAEL